MKLAIFCLSIFGLGAMAVDLPLSDLAPIKPDLPVTKSGECTPEFKSQFSSLKDTMGMLSALKGGGVGATDLMKLAPLAGGGSGDMLQKATSVLSSAKDFRTKNPGDFACNSTDAKGDKTVLNSHDTDSMIKGIEDYLPKLK